MIVAIEGNIGAGKTTLTYELKNLGFHVLEEPVDSWKLGSGAKEIDMLAAFYDNPRKMAFLFQQLCLKTKAKQLMLTKQPKQWCLDRSLAADRIFATLQHEQGNISDVELGIYDAYYEWFDTMLPKVDKYIYLKTPVDICLKRIRLRDRPCERDISGKYLEKLEAKHEAWLAARDDVLVLDGRRSVFKTEERREMLDEIKQFLAI